MAIFKLNYYQFLESNFTTDIRYLIDTKKNIPIKLDYIKNVSKIDAQLQNNFIILLDKTYKVEKIQL